MLILPIQQPTRLGGFDLLISRPLAFTVPRTPALPIFPGDRLLPNELILWERWRATVIVTQPVARSASYCEVLRIIAAALRTREQMLDRRPIWRLPSVLLATLAHRGFLAAPTAAGSIAMTDPFQSCHHSSRRYAVFITNISKTTHCQYRHPLWWYTFLTYY